MSRKTRGSTGIKATPMKHGDPTMMGTIISQDGLTICVFKCAVTLRAEETFPVKDVK